MCKDDVCNLIGRQCYLTRYGHVRCSDKPTLHNAAECIQSLDEKYLELEREVAALDEWNERLKTSAIGDKNTAAGSH